VAASGRSGAISTRPVEHCSSKSNGARQEAYCAIHSRFAPHDYQKVAPVDPKPGGRSHGALHEVECVEVGAVRPDVSRGRCGRIRWRSRTAAAAIHTAAIHTVPLVGWSLGARLSGVRQTLWFHVPERPPSPSSRLSPARHSSCATAPIRSASTATAPERASRP
jgi:hypothetical protein